MLLKLSLVLIMVVWAFDKILNPGHDAAVLQGFYGLVRANAPLLKETGVTALNATSAPTRIALSLF